MLSQSILGAILYHIDEGNQIAILTKNTKQIIAQIDGAVHAGAITRIRRTNGNESIEFINGARITFHRDSNWLRGRTAHLVIAPMGLSTDDLLNIIPAANGGGEILGYM